MTSSQCAQTRREWLRMLRSSEHELLLLWRNIRDGLSCSSWLCKTPTSDGACANMPPLDRSWCLCAAGHSDCFLRRGRFVNSSADCRESESYRGGQLCADLRRIGRVLRGAWIGLFVFRGSRHGGEHSNCPFSCRNKSATCVARCARSRRHQQEQLGRCLMGSLENLAHPNFTPWLVAL